MSARPPLLRTFGLAPGELVVDNFAGGGGASTGIEAAIGRPVDIVGDWLDPTVTDEQLLQVADVLRRNECRQHPHTIILLTKQAKRLNSFFRRLRWWGGSLEHPKSKLWLTDELDDSPSRPMPSATDHHAWAGHLGMLLPHFWAGVTVTCPEDEWRAPLLLATPLRRRFLSLEPLTGPARPVLSLVRTTPGTYPAGAETRLDLVILGGMSGPGATPMHPDWVRAVRDRCDAADVSFAFKQWGEWKPISEMPEAEYSALYRSNIQAGEGEDQAVIDEVYGRHCTVATTSVDFDGGKGFHVVDGHVGYQTFRCGKRAAGRRLDGREHWALPWVTGPAAPEAQP